MKVVLDTNVLVSALRSSRGAAYRVVSLVGTGRFETTISVPLVLEYEEILLRHAQELTLAESDITDLLDYVCGVSEHRSIFFLWRPLLSDPEDDLVLEIAVTAGCDAIITYNTSHFAGVTDEFGIEILTPAELLQRLGELP